MSLQKLNFMLAILIHVGQTPNVRPFGMNPIFSDGTFKFAKIYVDPPRSPADPNYEELGVGELVPYEYRHLSAFNSPEFETLTYNHIKRPGEGKVYEKLREEAGFLPFYIISKTRRVKPAAISLRLTDYQVAKTLFNRIFLRNNQQGLCCTHIAEPPYAVSNNLLEVVHSFCFHLSNNIIDSIHHFSFFHTRYCSNFLQHLWHRVRFCGYENKGCWHSSSPNNYYVTTGIFLCRLLEN